MKLYIMMLKHSLMKTIMERNVQNMVSFVVNIVVIVHLANVVVQMDTVEPLMISVLCLKDVNQRLVFVDVVLIMDIVIQDFVVMPTVIVETPVIIVLHQRDVNHNMVIVKAVVKALVVVQMVNVVVNMVTVVKLMLIVLLQEVVNQNLENV